MKRTTAELKLNHFLGDFTMRFPIRNDLHLARKMWHFIMGLLIVSIYSLGVSRSLGVIILGSVLGFDLILEGIRLKNPIWNDKFLRFWGPFMRAHEVREFSTVPHYVSAAMIAVGVFPKPVAILSILYLACGDPFASLMGILFGHKGPTLGRGKTWVGTSAGVLICTLVTFFYLKTTMTLSGASLWVLSWLGGFVGGTVELLPLEIDDNFTIPVVSGFVLWLIFMVLGV